MSYIYNTLSWAHRVPYKVETVEIVKSPERMKKKQQKSRHENPLPTKNSRKIWKTTIKNWGAALFEKRKKKHEKKQTNNSKKEKKNENHSRKKQQPE